MAGLRPELSKADLSGRRLTNRIFIFEIRKLIPISGTFFSKHGVWWSQQRNCAIDFSFTFRNCSFKFDQLSILVLCLYSLNIEF